MRPRSHLKPAKIVEEGKAAGLSFSVAYVYSIRQNAKAHERFAYLPHVEGKMDVAIERYLSLVRQMVAVPGAIDSDVGWTVAVDLMGFMGDAKDHRVDDVRRSYDAARERDALWHTTTPKTSRRRWPRDRG
jgi:hypothetical protein